jgi:pimeloyl-ACP methyl ester carboxylesterase
MTSALHVEESGAAGGDRVVLLHSSGFSGRQWKKLAQSVVDRGMRAVVPDLTGHGASPPFDETQAFDFHVDVDAAVALLDEPAHLVGHSYGGLIALKAAQARSNNVRSLAVFDPVSFGVLDVKEDAVAIRAMNDVAVEWAKLEDEAWLTRFVDFWGGDGAWLGLRDPVRAEFRRTARVVRAGVTSLAKDSTPLDAYAHFAFPVLAMTGASSPPVAQRVVDRISTGVAHGSKHVVDGAGHFGPVTHADEVNAKILAHVASVRAP